MSKPSRLSWKLTVCLASAALAIVVVLAVPRMQSLQERGAAKPKPVQSYQFPVAQLASLHAAVQRRFDDLSRPDFGFSRMGPQHGDFQADTPQEKEVIAGLNRAKVQVLFYTIKNQFHEEYFKSHKADLTRGPLFLRRGTVSRPLARYEFVDSKHPGAKRYKSPADAPTSLQLASLALSMSKDPNMAKGARSSMGRWDVAMVPLVATDQQCVGCHAGMPVTKFDSEGHMSGEKVKKGSTLGYAVYCVTEDKPEVKQAQVVK